MLNCTPVPRRVVRPSRRAHPDRAAGGRHLRLLNLRRGRLQDLHARLAHSGWSDRTLLQNEADLDLLYSTSWQQRIKLRTEAVASVVNFRTVQNFQPVWSEGEQAGLGRPVASAAVPQITGLMMRSMIWTALKFTTLDTA